MQHQLRQKHKTQTVLYNGKTDCGYLGKIEQNAESLFENVHMRHTTVALVHQLEQHINRLAISHSLT